MVPLNFKILQTGLGPGYQVGFYGWSGLEGRIKNCKITDLENLQHKYSTFMSPMNEPFEEFSEAFDEFHGEGHVSIATACSPLNGEGGMWYTEVSARDPIFYRWHQYLENIIQDYRNRNYEQ